MSRGSYSDKAAAYKFAGGQLKRFYTLSSSRIDALVDYSRTLRAKREEHLNEIASDILRAAVVLLHATVEDFLRSVESHLLPYCGEDSLKDIPLVGQNKSAKLHLGHLAAHRGKRVDDLIQESVDKKLTERTYNNKDSIVALLKKIGIRPEAASSLYAPIEKLMARRHLIVHKADLQNGERKSISPKQVEQWHDAVAEFVRVISTEIPELSGATEVSE